MNLFYFISFSTPEKKKLGSTRPKKARIALDTQERFAA